MVWSGIGCERTPPKADLVEPLSPWEFAQEREDLASTSGVWSDDGFFKTPRSRAESTLGISIPTVLIVYPNTGPEKVLYRIQCSWGHQGWRADRRYSQFRELYQQMSSTGCSGQKSKCSFNHAPSLPSRMLTSRGNRTLLRIKERKDGLEAFLGSMSVLCQRHRQCVENFLRLSNPDEAPGILFAQSHAHSLRRVYVYPAPTSLRSYEGVDVELFDLCSCSIRRTARGYDMVITVPPGGGDGGRVGEGERLNALLVRLLGPSVFPTVDEARAAVADLRRKSRHTDIAEGPFSQREPVRGREEERDEDGQKRAHTLPAPRQRSRGAGDRFSLRHTPSWQRLCNATPPSEFPGAKDFAAVRPLRSPRKAVQISSFVEMTELEEAALNPSRCA